LSEIPHHFQEQFLPNLGLHQLLSGEALDWPQ